MDTLPPVFDQWDLNSLQTPPIYKFYYHDSIFTRSQEDNNVVVLQLDLLAILKTEIKPLPTSLGLIFILGKYLSLFYYSLLYYLPNSNYIRVTFTGIIWYGRLVIKPGRFSSIPYTDQRIRRARSRWIRLRLTRVNIRKR